jgi:hypothetical protein
VGEVTKIGGRCLHCSRFLRVKCVQMVMVLGAMMVLGMRTLQLKGCERVGTRE